MTRRRKTSPKPVRPPVEPSSDPLFGDDEEENERVLDGIVHFMGAYLADRTDFSDPRHERFLAWQAEQARAALTPAERRDLERQGDEIVRRVAAERQRLAARRGVVRERPTERVVPAQAGQEAVRQAASAGCAARFDLEVAAGNGRELWDEPCEAWIEVSPDLPVGEYLALAVLGDSMEPMLHAGDTILVRLGSTITAGDVVVARRPDDGYVVKRVGAVHETELVLESANADYDDVRIPRDPRLMVGVVVLQWCVHE